LASLRAKIGEDPTACAGLVKNVVAAQNDLTKLLKNLGQNQSKELIQRLQVGLMNFIIINSNSLIDK
jgi:hypothetical protein